MPAGEILFGKKGVCEMRRVTSFICRAVSFLAACLFCGSPLIFAQDNPIPQQVQDWQKAAETFQKAGNSAGAQAEYEKIAQLYPNTPYGLDACARIGSLHVAQKQFENLQPVIIQLCTNFRDQPGAFRVLSDLVKDCMHAKAYPEALSLCSEADSQFSSHPRRALITGWRGMVYAHQGNVAEAEQAVQLLIEQDRIASDFLDAIKDIGWGYFCAGRLDEAMGIYRQGLRRHPDHKGSVFLQYNLVRTCLRKGDPEAADREMETLLTQHRHRQIGRAHV